MAACNEYSGEVRQQLGVCMAHVYEHIDMGMGMVRTKPNTVRLLPNNLCRP